MKTTAGFLPVAFRTTLRTALILILTFSIFSPPNLLPLAGSQPAAAFSPAEQAAVVVVQPDLTPEYDPATYCVTAWYDIETGYDNALAYLTQNVNDNNLSNNSAIWKPTLPQAGTYLVEAYIPAHDPITWECTNERTIASDTADAHYTIQYDGGEKTISRSQAANAGKWVSLGVFPFKSGDTGTVSLSDLNDEDSFQYTVSFSAVRFTKTESVPTETYLPLVFKDWSPFTLDAAWTSSSTGVTEAFNPGETIIYSVKGTNTADYSIQATLNWKITDACGGVTTASETKLLAPGTWTVSRTSTLGACRGISIFTLEVSARGQTGAISGLYAVNYPSQVAITNQQAFDKCNVASIGDMAKWWKYSPYFSVNLYIGGIHRHCDNTALDAYWVSNVAAQGWSFIPTWVGPQAPCTSFKYRMSYDPDDAYIEGKNEAKAAYAAADKLGLGSQSIIYYDLERYYVSNTACSTAVNAFLKGWTEQMHSLNLHSGVYGHNCNATPWYSISPRPDAVWVAAWFSSPYQYIPNVSVYGLSCLKDIYWNDHQRIRQYAGDHSETYAGVTMGIDSNATDGEVAIIPQGTTYTSLSASAEIPAPTVAHLLPEVQDMQLVSDTSGWVQVDSALYWTDDGGQTWREITPAQLVAGEFAAGEFFNDREGWLAAYRAAGGALQLLTSSDRGQSWTGLPLPLDPLEDPVEALELSFTGPQSGWLAAKLASGSNFSLGRLWSTTDGGQTWEERTLPVAGQIRFFNESTGFVVGGAAGDELYATFDGGRQWQPVALESADTSGALRLPGLPQFSAGSQTGILPVTVLAEQPLLEVYATEDGGRSWSRSESLSLPVDASPASPLPFAADHQGNWLSALPSGDSTLSGGPGAGSGQSLQPSSLPAGIVDLELSASGTGWARTWNGQCQGDKAPSETPGVSLFTCTIETGLWRTIDRGLTWEEITPGE